MRVVAVVAARMGSTRLPGKVMMSLEAVPVLSWVVRAARHARMVNDVWIATTTDERDDVIVETYDKVKNIAPPIYRGSETDVLKRYTECARAAKADIIVRLTGDCPFLDPNVIDEVVTLQRVTGTAYAQNVSPASFPDGLDCEAITHNALETAHREATRPSDRDCLTQYLERDRMRFPNAALVCPIPGLSKERFVLDTADDLAFCREIAKRLPPAPPRYTDILKILDNEPHLRSINSKWQRNERFYASVVHEHA